MVDAANLNIGKKYITEINNSLNEMKLSYATQQNNKYI